MFFRRILERKDSQISRNFNSTNANGETNRGETMFDLNTGSNSSKDDKNDTNNNHSSNGNGNGYHNMPYRKHISPVASNEYPNSDSPIPHNVQLTPLWEHILRTRRLPETICIASMFTEFYDRLEDPEWQVRQHALRVLVDVLVVMGAKADKYMDQLIPQLVENLGHQAPTIRKGALDCLRVYLSETAMPETIMLHILDVGLNVKSDEILRERLTCGVMLSLPALLQSIMHTSKYHFVLGTVFDMLVPKIYQVTHQEVALKVLSKIRELIGEVEFSNYITKSDFTEYEQLCRVYGLNRNESGTRQGPKTGAWRALQRTHSQENCWRSPSGQSSIKNAEFPEKNKIIMETEIKINEDTLTMRIVEADTEAELDSPNEEASKYPNSLEGEIVCKSLVNEKTDREQSGILQVLSDSDADEHNSHSYSLLTPMTPTRALKRVTFGGEVIKMRTPDSDATSSNNNANAKIKLNDLKVTEPDNEMDGTKTPNSKQLPAVNIVSPAVADNNSTKILTVDIQNDNTKPLPRPKSLQSFHYNNSEKVDLETKPDPSGKTTPIKTKSADLAFSLSPGSSYRCKSISPVDSIVSPKTPHKEIEVLHNLQQRDPSPSVTPKGDTHSDEQNVEMYTKNRLPQTEQYTARTWEDLNIVDSKVLMNLRSGDWRNRLHGLSELALALSSSKNLASVQPHLDSLLRTLLSSERNYEVAEMKRDLLINLTTRLPLDNLEDRTLQILSGLCRQGNAGANRVCKALMQRLPAGTIVAKLTSSEFLHSKSSKFREHALQMAIYALMTFPSTCFDKDVCVTNATYAALNRKRRVRQAALEMMAVLDSISPSHAVTEIVESVTQEIDGAMDLLAAVKARILRKQLPIITADDALIYTAKYDLDGPTDSRVSNADIEWVLRGEGSSASPTTQKKRRDNQLRKNRFSQQLLTNPHNPDTYFNNSFPNENREGPYSHLSPGDYGTTNEESSNFTYKYNNGNLSHGQPLKKSKAFSSIFLDRNMRQKACSDSSMDGRSSDSTNTGSSGSSSIINSLRSSRDSTHGQRFARLTSRFPTMNQIDLDNSWTPHIWKSTVQYPKQLTSTDLYPKINYNLSKPQHRKLHKQQSFQNQKLTIQDNAQESFNQKETQLKKHMNSKENPSYTYSVPKELKHGKNINQTEYFGTPDQSVDLRNKPPEKTINSIDVENDQDVEYCPTDNIHIYTYKTGHDLPNIDKFPPESNIISIQLVEEGNPLQQAQNDIAQDMTHMESKPGSPISVKSTVYSQKSTASVNSYYKCEQTEESNPDGSNNESIAKYQERSVSGDLCKLENEFKSDTKEHPLGALVIDEIQTFYTGTAPKSEESLNSLHSKTESIKTLLEDTPTTLSRAQSVKSVAIEEEIEGSSSFVIVENSQNQLNTAGNDVSSETDSPRKEAKSDELDYETDKNDVQTKVNSYSTNAEEARASSRSISLDSLFDRPQSKQGSLDTSTTDFSSQSNSQLNASTPALILKSQSSPIKEKPKATYFLRNRRRISPVKQSIKISQAELFPQNMTKFEKPREALLKTFDQLDSSNWEINMFGLKAMVRLMRYHPEYLENQMHMVCIQLTRSVRNLRSQVARGACQAATELFSLKSKFLEQECDDLVCALLHRTADTNRFLRADASRALESMCDNLQPLKILNILTTKGAQHQNALVRTTAAKLLNRLVDRLGCDRVYAMTRENRDKFFIVGANLLLEGSLETRSYAKSLFRALSEHPNFQRLLVEVIPSRTYRNVEKTLKNITR